MEAKQILYFFTVLVLVYCANLGLALKCHQCSGSINECNNVTAKPQDCAAGLDRCSIVEIDKDGKQSVILGCANINDCNTAVESCNDTEKNNVRTTCKPACCTGEMCNTAPAKETNLRCYECQSAMSMSDCIQNSKATTCLSTETKCAKFTAELMMGDKKLMVYRKGCRAADACEKKLMTCSCRRVALTTRVTTSAAKTICVMQARFLMSASCHCWHAHFWLSFTCKGV
ncbi:hypothetical protein OS493_003811 [Desmophyllum pertusum]|uniref:Uncharacterized protein n=1 Tax=Desmophyllum pertusum TaxID=174260 RepID=A0A9X0A6N9_9CNID|nr:hypothetical protein OS493_003811 [Desmophyllum pertusum]